MRAINQYLSFRIGKEEYGIDILKVQEIRGYEPATRMVNAPAHVLGVLNLTDKVVGMVVDSVSDVVDLKPEQIKPAPEFSGAIGQGDVLGLGTLGEGEASRMLILLDIERVMGGARQEAPVEEAAL